MSSRNLATFMEPYKRLIAADYVHTYNHLNEEFESPVTVKRRQLKCTRTLVLSAILVVIVLTVITTIISVKITASRSVISNYELTSTQIERPQWWTKAIQDAQILEQYDPFPVVISPKEVMWIFRDTVVNCSMNCNETAWYRIANTAMIITYTASGDIETADYISVEGKPRQLIGNENDEDNDQFRVWPKTAVTIGEEVYLFWAVVKKVSAWNYSMFANGKGIASREDKSLNFTRLYHDNIDDLASIEASVIGVDDYTYFYMLRGTNFDLNVLVARATAQDLNGTVPYYTFFTGDFDSEDAFSTDVQYTYADAKSIIKNFQGSSISVNYNNFLQQYCLLSSGLNTVSIYTSMTPWGPWSRPVVVYTVPEEQQGYGIVQAAHFHPELWKFGGAIMVFSYSVTDGGDGHPYLVELSLT